MDYIISITACDRAGIIAGVSQAVYECGGNLIAASQTVHRGYFAMIIMCHFEATPQTGHLEDLIRQYSGQDLHVFITPWQAQPAPVPQATQQFIITALGPDRAGILSNVAAYLGSRGININDLYCFVDEGGEFVVICQVTVPNDLEIVMIQTDLDSIGREIDVCIQMRQENIFVATNELRLPAAR